MGQKKRRKKKKKYNKTKFIKSLSRVFSNLINTTTKDHGDKKKYTRKKKHKKRFDNNDE